MTRPLQQQGDTAVLIRELFDPAHLADVIEAGYVRMQTHPTLPLRILNYTEKAAYEGVWDDVTLTCRGLIVADSGEVVARPWRKFHNYGDQHCGALDLTASAEVTDKHDGSLGILYPTPDGWAVATRGSFTSEQAIHATALLRDRYDDFEPPDGMTVLVEIVYPANRIVLDYDGTDDLFLLGAVDIKTGEAVGPDWVSGWYGAQTDTFSAATLAEALALPPRPNAEGVVVRLVDSGQMVKIKQADYVALHRIVTGLNARIVWQMIGDGKTLADICEPLPDEFHPWVEEIAADLSHEMVQIITGARREHAQIVASLPNGWTRKDYAAIASKSANRAWLFMLLDDRDPSPKIWRTLQPAGDVRPTNYSEDAA